MHVRVRVWGQYLKLIHQTPTPAPHSDWFLLWAGIHDHAHQSLAVAALWPCIPVSMRDVEAIGQGGDAVTPVSPP